MVIYTTSQFECPWCIKAKELLNIYGYDFFEKDIHTNAEYKKEFIEAGHKTVPQVYLDDTLIGGHDALQSYLRGSTAGAKNEKLRERLIRI
jgi:glutaredoxin